MINVIKGFGKVGMYNIDLAVGAVKDRINVMFEKIVKVDLRSMKSYQERERKLWILG